MNTKFALIVAISAFSAIVSSAASASEATPEDIALTVSASLSREAVRQSVLQARASGDLISGEVSRFSDTKGEPLSRAQVAAEAREAVRLGVAAGGNTYTAEITLQQQERIRQAGLRALAVPMASR